MLKQLEYPILEETMADMLKEMGSEWYEIGEFGYLLNNGRSVRVDVLRLLAESGWLQGRTVHTTVWGQIDPDNLDEDAGRYHEVRLTLDALMWEYEHAE